MKQALTLIELLLVIFIIAIVLGLSTPFLTRNIENTKLNAFVNKVYYLLDYAKNRAVLKSEIMQVNFNTNENKIVLKNKEDQTNISRSLNIPKEINLQLSDEDIYFYPDSTLQEFEIFIHNNRKKFKIFSLGFNGKISINEEN